MYVNPMNYTNSVWSSVKDTSRKVYNSVGDLCGRSAISVKKFHNSLQTRTTAAASVFLVANIISQFISGRLADRMCKHDRLKNDKYKNFYGGAAVAVLTGIGNIFISKFCYLPLGKIIAVGVALVHGAIYVATRKASKPKHTEETKPTEKPPEKPFEKPAEEPNKHTEETKPTEKPPEETKPAEEPQSDSKDSKDPNPATT